MLSHQCLAHELTSLVFAGGNTGQGSVLELQPDSVVYDTATGEQHVNTDLLVLATGYRLLAQWGNLFGCLLILLRVWLEMIDHNGWLNRFLTEHDQLCASICTPFWTIPIYFYLSSWFVPNQ